MSNIIIEKRSYRLTGLTPVLGSWAASRYLRTQYIASKAPTPELADEEDQIMASLDEKGLTVFTRNDKDELCMMGYQIKGFFKGALKAIRVQANVAAAASKVDTLLFVSPRYIPIMRDGETIRDEDEVCERPLRGNRNGIEQIALAASEQIDDPWYIDIEIAMIPSKGTAKSDAMTWETIETALDYGAYHGLGQWRSADWGRFSWERLDKDEDEAEPEKKPGRKAKKEA